MPRKRPDKAGPRRPPGPAPGPAIGTVGKRLAALMRARGVTQSELARLSGVPQPRINALVQGRVRFPRVERLDALANALGVDRSRLVSGLGRPVAVSTVGGEVVQAYDLSDEVRPRPRPRAPAAEAEAA